MASSSTAAPEKVQQTADQAAERAGQVAHEAGEKAAQAVGGARQEIEQRVERSTTQAGERVEHVVSALRASASSLEDQGDRQAADAARAMADRADRVAGYLRGADTQSLMQDGNRAVRQRPWVFAAGGVIAGLVAARMVRSGAESLAATDGHRPDGHAIASSTVAPPPTATAMVVGDEPYVSS